MSDEEMIAHIERELEKIDQPVAVEESGDALVISGFAAYRTQLFCYLKSCGQQELGTVNLWAGMDMPPKKA